MVVPAQLKLPVSLEVLVQLVVMALVYLLSWSNTTYLPLLPLCSVDPGVPHALSGKIKSISGHAQLLPTPMVPAQPQQRSV